MKTLKVIGNVVTNILLIIVCLLLLFALYVFVNLKVLNKSYVNLFGYTYFNTITGSMEDTININDYVFVKINDKYEVDDIISFMENDVVVTHRIIEINDEGIITKGDNNNTKDEMIKKDQVIGRVVYIGKEYGVYLKVATTPIVFISFFVTIILFSWLFKKED